MVLGVSSTDGPSTPTLFGGETCSVNMFIIDLANKKIQFKTKMSKASGSREKKITDLLNICLTEAKQ